MHMYEICIYIDKLYTKNKVAAVGREKSKRNNGSRSALLHLRKCII